MGTILLDAGPSTDAPSCASTACNLSGHCRGQKASLTSPSGHQHPTDLASPKERILQSWSSFFAWFCVSTGGEDWAHLRTAAHSINRSEPMSIACSWTCLSTGNLQSRKVGLCYILTAVEPYFNLPQLPPVHPFE